MEIIASDHTNSRQKDQDARLTCRDGSSHALVDSIDRKLREVAGLLGPPESASREISTDALSVAAGLTLRVLGHKGCQRLFTSGAPSYIKAIAHAAPLVFAGLVKDYSANDGRLDATDWIRGTTVYSGSLLLSHGAKSVLRPKQEMFWGQLQTKSELTKRIVERERDLLRLMNNPVGSSTAREAARQEFNLLKNSSALSPTRGLTPSRTQLELDYRKMPDRAIDHFRRVQWESSLQPPVGLDPNLRGLGNLLAARYCSSRSLNVLELGPSSTTNVPLCLGRNMELYIGVDAMLLPLKQQQVLLHGKTFRHLHVQADVCRLPIPSRTQDLVVASHNNVFYSGKPLEVELLAKEVSRVLKPSGEFALQPWSFFRQSPETTEILLRNFKIVGWQPYQSRPAEYLLVLRPRFPGELRATTTMRLPH